MSGEAGRPQEAPMAPQWEDYIPAEAWSVYARVINAANQAQIRFALGGSLAIMAYTGVLRQTKDLDLYVVPDDRDAMVALLTELGLGDYYETEAYDRGWIYRAVEGQTIVDVIWAMANRRAQVDEAWLQRGKEIEVHGISIRVLPPEELIWSKLYVFQRQRCDWPGILKLVYAVGPSLDWAHLLDRLGHDDLLLGGVLSIFMWLCPGRAQDLPAWLWERLHLPAPPKEPMPEVDLHNVDLFDTRPWFFPKDEAA